MKNSTKMILIGVAILLIVILLVLISKFAFNKKQPDLVSTNTVSNENTTSSTPTTTPTNTPKNIPQKKAPAPVLNYAELIKKYEGYRFQFSSNCTQVTPNSVVIKSGSQFMIDNREDKSHTFVFDKQKYPVKAYGYAIVTTKTTGRLAILCDDAQRAVVTVVK